MGITKELRKELECLRKEIACLRQGIFPDIPDRTSQLLNDGEFGVSTYIEDDELSDVAFSGDYNDLINFPVIPPAITNTSQLTNDGADGNNPFITAQDLPIVPPEQDLDSVLGEGNSATNKTILLFGSGLGEFAPGYMNLGVGNDLFQANTFDKRLYFRRGTNPTSWLNYPDPDIFGQNWTFQKTSGTLAHLDNIKHETILLDTSRDTFSSAVTGNVIAKQYTIPAGTLREGALLRIKCKVNRLIGTGNPFMTLISTGLNGQTPNQRWFNGINGLGVSRYRVMGDTQSFGYGTSGGFYDDLDQPTVNGNYSTITVNRNNDLQLNFSLQFTAIGAQYQIQFLSIEQIYI